MLEYEKVQKEFFGPQCMIKYLDLGIAVGSAAAKAKDLCIDNRVLYSAGATACYFKMIDADVAMGLPLSVKGKKTSSLIGSPLEKLKNKVYSFNY